MRRLLPLVACCLLSGLLFPAATAEAAQPELPEEFASKSPKERQSMYVTAISLAQVALESQTWDMAIMSLEPMMPVIEADFGLLDNRTRMVAELLVKAYEGAGKKAEAAAVRGKYLDSEAATQSGEADKLLGAALTAYNEGRYEAAARDGEKAIAMISSVTSDSNPVLSRYRDMLANVYEHLYRQGEAEALLKKNLDVAKLEKRRDPLGGAALVASARQRLASHYIGRGSLREAETLAKALLADARTLSGQTKTTYEIIGHLILASAARNRNDHDAAHAEAEKAVGIATSGQVEPLVAALTLGFWATALSYKGEHEEAIKAQEMVLEYRRRTAKDDSELSTDIFGYALILRHAKRYDEAEANFEKVLAIEEAKYGKDSPELHPTINWLTETRWARGDGPDVILPSAFRASDLKERGLSLVLASGSEEQRRDFIKRYVDGTDRIITYDLGHAGGHPGATELAANTVLRRKGRVLDAMTSEIRTRVGQATGAERETLDALVRVRNQLGTLSFRGPGDGVSPEAHASMVAKLEAEEEQLQRKLGSTVDLASIVSDELITWERVRDRIPKDGVLIEIVQYNPFDINYATMEKAFGPPRYVAYVIRPGQDHPVAVQLGDVKTIDALVKRFRQSVIGRDPNIEDVARELDERVFDPLRRHFGSAKHVLVSPDGHLNLTSFGALVDKRGNYEVENYEFTYLGSGRDLLRLTGENRGSAGTVFIGDPDFDLGGSMSGDSGRRSSDLGDLKFADLPGTQEEIEAVAKLFPGSTVYTQANATEGRLRGVASPSILHVATHGFFLKDTAYATADEGRGLDIVDDTGNISMPENPLLRSGLALAGANGRSDGSHDGIVTALELGNLDLRGTELVVLSACETGIGEVDPGEGVYGLRRSLVMAGAESQIISLWQVDDEATRDLMIDFYRRIKKGKGRSESLRGAQLKLLKKKRTSHPYFWAAFIPSGQWAPLGVSEEVESTVAKDKPERRPRRKGRFGDWMKDSFDDEAEVVLVGFDISRPVPGNELDGVDFDAKRGWGLTMDITRRRRGMFGARYGYQRLRAPDHPLDPEARINRFSLRMQVDLLALPWDIAVRPAIWGVASGGIAWGRDKLTDPATLGRSETWRIGGSFGLGAEAGLTFRTKSNFVFGVRGGIEKPWIGLWSKGDLGPYMEAANALRWMVTIVMGTGDE